MLARPAGVLRSAAGPGAVLGRFGGDGLVALLLHTDLRAAHRVADDVRRAVRELSAVTHRPTGSVTVSVGVAARTGPAPDVAALLWATDAALCEAKRGARTG